MSSLDHLIKKLAGASPSVTEKSEAAVNETAVEKTSLVYVEKLASAVDFIVDSLNSEQVTEKVAQPVVVDEAEAPSATSTRLKDSLVQRLKAKTAAPTKVEKTEEVSAEDSKLIQNVLNRIKDMKTSTQEEASVDTVEDEINQIYNTNTEEPQIEADGEAAEKAASADLSLADVLNAALNTEEQCSDSDQVVDDEVAKTANVQGSNGLNARKDATKILKERLLAKIGGEEAQS